MHTYVVIGVIINILLIFCMVIDHILKLPFLIIEPSQIFIDGLVMNQSVHQVVRILR